MSGRDDIDAVRERLMAVMALSDAWRVAFVAMVKAACAERPHAEMVAEAERHLVPIKAAFARVRKLTEEGL